MKNLARTALRKVGLEVKRIPFLPDPELQYLKEGRIPWSRGYAEAKERSIREVLANPALLDIFRSNSKLPEQFGVGLDERYIEYPWLLAHIRPDPERMLDAGSILNHAFILDRPVFREKKLHILTLAPETNASGKWEFPICTTICAIIPIRD